MADAAGGYVAHQAHRRQRWGGLIRGAAPYAALGLAVAQLSALGLNAPVDLALGTGARVALGAWALRAVLRLIGGRPGAPALASALGWSWQAVVVATLLLMVVALQRAPSRLIANLLGYAVIALPALWLAHRRAGESAATLAALVLAVFVLVPTHVDWRAAEGTQLRGAETAFVWSAGWPTPDAALRHEVTIPPQLHGKRLSFVALLAERYTGTARVHVTANGQDLGPAEYGSDGWGVGTGIPAELVRAGQPLALELRLRPHDPRVRLLAHRWTGGATRGPTASAYFDAQRWWPGTFSSLTGRAREGVYMVYLSQTP